jgi:tetratricopeptide (TPR) repeat protein
MFRLRKKNKEGDKIDQLLHLLERDPENTNHRLRLADQYLRTGNRKSAIQEYQRVAKYLGNEGFNLKAMSIYKKLFSLDGMSLNDYRSLAALYSEEGLLAEAKKTYRTILRLAPEDQDAQKSLEDLDRDEKTPLDHQTTVTFEEKDVQLADEDDAVPIETLLDPSEERAEDSAAPRTLTGESLDRRDLNNASSHIEWPSEGTSSSSAEDFEIDLSSLKIDDLLQNADSREKGESDFEETSDGKLPLDMEVGELPEKEETREEAPSPATGESIEIDMESLQTGAFSHAETSSDNPGSEIGALLREPIIRDEAVGTLEDLPLPPEQKSGIPLEGPSAADTSACEHEPSQEDPRLHYHLGVAYREMELTDKAIEEFSKALEQGNNPFECLTMLGKCHFEKGLFRKAAEFIHRALGLENLTQEQTDLLRQQLQDVEAVGKLD